MALGTAREYGVAADNCNELVKLVSCNCKELRDGKSERRGDTARLSPLSTITDDERGIQESSCDFSARSNFLEELCTYVTNS